MHSTNFYALTFQFAHIYAYFLTLKPQAETENRNAEENTSGFIVVKSLSCLEININPVVLLNNPQTIRNRVFFRKYEERRI